MAEVAKAVAATNVVAATVTQVVVFIAFLPLELQLFTGETDRRRRVLTSPLSRSVSSRDAADATHFFGSLAVVGDIVNGVLDSIVIQNEEARG